MKTLFLLRHAKSSWEDPSLADFERPLNPRGLKAAKFIGQLMREKGIRPSIIITSPAERAKQTTEIVRKAAGWKCEAIPERRIYEASVRGLVEISSGIDDNFPSAMLVGHNPGFEGYVHYLTNQFESMPTGALAIMELAIDRWNEIAEGCGKLEQVLRPKQLMK